MTKKGLFGALKSATSSGSSKDAESEGTSSRRGPAAESAPVGKHSSLPTRIPSAKKLPSMDELTSQQGTPSVVGRFSSVEDEEKEDALGEMGGLAKSLPPIPRSSDGSNGEPRRQILTRAESSKSLRRGTPRPTELKKTLSTIKFVMEQSGLDQVKEGEDGEELKADFEVA